MSCRGSSRGHPYAGRERKETGNLCLEECCEPRIARAERCREGRFAANEGVFCWARIHDACAAGLGVSQPWRSPPRLCWSFAALAAGGSSTRRLFQRAAAIFDARPHGPRPYRRRARQHADQLTAALVRPARSASSRWSRARHLPHLHAARLSRGLGREEGAKISYIWDVTDAKGQRVARVSGDETIPNRSGSDPWSGVDSAALHNIAGKTASQVAASLSGGGAARRRWTRRHRPAHRPGSRAPSSSPPAGIPGTWRPAIRAGRIGGRRAPWRDHGSRHTRFRGAGRRAKNR